MTDYPQWICLDCGEKHGRNPHPTHAMTVHPDTCGICGATNVPCTEPRDFGHLKEGWEQS